MNDEDLKKILFSLYILRNVTTEDENWDTAQEAIYIIERHLGLDLADEMKPKTVSSGHVPYTD